MKTLFSLVFLFVSTVIYGQITFSVIPMDSQLVARNVISNLGTISIQGQVNKTGTPFDSVCLKVFRAGVQVDSVFQALTYTANNAPFSYTYNIPAELKEYKVQIYGISSSVQTLDTTIDALLAGDVYIIEGQSNALALMRDGGSAASNKSEFIRVFGNSDSNTAGLLNNLRWFQGEPDGGFTENGHTGQWGLRLARLLVDSLKIPVAVFNGACGGTPITYYMRQANYKTNINSNYARLYYRLTHTGLQAKVRAIMWSQGETDAKNGTSTATYVSEFDTLQKTWLQDYPGVQKIYILQTRNGGMPTYPFLNLQEIKEAQREVAVQHDTNVEIMSTSSLRQDSGDLHFDFVGGYEEFGNRLFNLIYRDIYNVAPTKEIDAPVITAAYMKDSTTLVIEENADSLMTHKKGIIDSYEIENAGSAVIDTIYLNKNKIIIELSKYPGSNPTVSYLAQPADSGNWVMNTGGIEVVCFYKYPVADSIPLQVTNLDKITVVSQFRVFPNPSGGKFFISNTSISNTEATVEIFNVMGEKIYTGRLNNRETKIDLSNYSKGIYMYRIIDSRNLPLSTGKIVIQ